MWFIRKNDGIEYFVNRSERRSGGEDARATVSDQQVNSGTPRYPVDRYLVERSNKLEMVNITEDDIWNAEPALRPEDEILLRKLHDMLQSTSDDLKLLSGELSKYHEPGVQVKSLPTPLDDDFNDKVHIEELVNAKFHGYKIVDKPQPTPAYAQKDKFDRILKSMPSDTNKAKKVIDTGIQVNQVQLFKKPVKSKKLSVSRTKIIEINKNDVHAIGGNEDNAEKAKEETPKPTVAYKELSFKYMEPKINMKSPKHLQLQNMPSINIRGELKEQKVLQLNIEPESTNNNENDFTKSNIAVISVQHEPVTNLKPVPNMNSNHILYSTVSIGNYSKEPIRKFSKMSSGESSEIDSHDKGTLVNEDLCKIRPYKSAKMVVKLQSRQHSEDLKNKRNNSNKKESAKHPNSNLEAWKKKLNAVYGCPTSSRKSKIGKSETKKVETKSKSSCSQPLKNSNMLNNAEYIPYSKLTLGGARISDIEKELSGITNKTDVKLGPILNKILSRENSFHNGSPQEEADEESPKILTTSDENLLREVLDIEMKVTNTLTTNFIAPNAALNMDQPLNVDDQDSYADDFEDEKSDYSAHSEKQNQLSDDAHPNEAGLHKSHDSDSDNESLKSGSSKENMQNRTFIKKANLSFKKNVDIFEFVPIIDTQDIAIQSNTTQKISLKETQTSPKNDKCSVQPIHNDLWPSIDPKGEVEKLFQLEKDFIKKLIIDEYGDLLEKNLNKPSTSKGNISNEVKNVTASQKNTQTSPAHVKSVMTSPTRTKTRTTSPITLSLTVDRQTSPIKEELKITVDDGDELGLSINLSSPRFKLRLPQTSCEVISNLESHSQSNQNTNENLSRREIRLAKNSAVSSSSSADGDYSSSDISSLGEVRFKLRKFQKLHVPILSELSSSSSVSKYSSDISDAIIPLRSEGELSLGQVGRRKSNKNIKSEGEASLRHQ